MRLKWLVVVTIAGIQLAAAGLVITATWQSVSVGVSDHARESMHRLGMAARDRFEHFIAPAEDTARLIRSLVVDGALALSDTDHLEHFLYEMLELHRVFGAVYYGQSNGEFLRVTRDAGSSGYLVKEIRLVDGAKRTTWRRRGTDYRLVETWSDPADRFDPRLLPWSSAFTETAEVHWTDSDVFFTANRPGVSTATALIGSGDTAWGMVSVDIEIAAFATFFTDLSSDQEVPFLVDRTGAVVARPERSGRWSSLFEESEATGEAALADTRFPELVDDALLHGRRFGEVAVDGQRFLVDIQAFGRASLPWLTAVAVPADTLYGWVHALRNQIVVVTGAMAVLAVLLTLIAWRYGVERPIAVVSSRLRRIAEGGLDPRPVLRGPSEFRELDAAAAETGSRIDARDTAYRHLVRTLREYEHAVQQSPAGIAILESDGTVVFANESYRRLVGPADPLGAVPAIFTTPGGPAESVAARMETVSAGRTVREDVTVTREDDNQSVVLQCVTAPLLPDGGSEGQALLLVEDVTGRKRVEYHLVEARNAAERSDRAKTAFLGQMSHELRTPLNAIIGFSEVIRSEMFGPIGSSRYADYVSHIETSAKHLKDLIDRVLDLSRVEQGVLQVTFREIDPLEPVRVAIDMVGPTAADAGVALALELGRERPPPAVIVADPSAVRQILVNLISNAVKFSPRGATVCTVLSGMADGGTEIVVSDQGVGIEPQDLPHVFEPFWQGGSALEAGRVGVGLGLAIVRALVDRHGGRIDIDSRPGEGTRVRVALPVDPPASMPGMPA